MYETFDDLLREIRRRDLECPTFVCELAWLHRIPLNAGVRLSGKPIIECGTLSGISAMMLAHGALCREITVPVYSIDNYEAYKIRPETGKSFAEVQKVINEMGFGNYIKLFEADDVEFLANLEERAAAIYIDSLHTYSHVKDVLNESISSIAEGGLICGHDYCWLESGLVKAVEEWRLENKDRLSGFATVERIWWTIVTNPK